MITRAPPSTSSSRRESSLLASCTLTWRMD
jgi:hypothetical protein